MAISPIVYTADEEALIATAKSHKMEWGCEALAGLRKRIKQFYLDEQNLCCCYCRRRNLTKHGRVWDIEHVVAQVLDANFVFEPENLAVSCIDCNSAKSDQVVLLKPATRFPRTSGAYSIIHPHYDRWEDHFVFGQIVYAPKSPKGARTLEMCKLYRYYQMEGQDALLSQDRRYANLAEQALFSKTASEAEPAVIAIGELVKKAVEAESRATAPQDV